MKRHFLTGLKAFAVGALAFAAVSCYDDQPIWEEIEGLKDRVTALEEKLNTEVATINSTLGTLAAADEKLAADIAAVVADVKKVNETLTTLDAYDKTLDGKIADLNAALEAFKTEAEKQLAAAVAQIAVVKAEKNDAGNYVLTFADGKTLEVAAADANANNTGVITTVDVEGVTYWAVIGADGKTTVLDAAVHPDTKLEFKVDPETNELLVAYDGKTWEQTGVIVNDETTINVVTAFKDGEDYVTLTVGGKEYQLPKYVVDNSSLVLGRTGAYFAYGVSKTVEFTAEDITEYYVMSKPDGWKANLDGTTLTVTAPTESIVLMGAGEVEGEILIHATAETGVCKVVKLNVTAGPGMKLSYKDGDITFFSALTSSEENWYGDVWTEFTEVWFGLTPIDEFLTYGSFEAFIATQPEPISSMTNIMLNETQLGYVEGEVEELQGTMSLADVVKASWSDFEYDEEEIYVMWLVPCGSSSYLYDEAIYVITGTYVDIRTTESLYNNVHLNATMWGADEYIIGSISKSQFDEWMSEEEPEYTYEVALEQYLMGSWMPGPFANFTDGDKTAMGVSYKSGNNQTVSLSDILLPEYGQKLDVNPNTEYFVWVLPYSESKPFSEYTLDDLLISTCATPALQLNTTIVAAAVLESVKFNSVTYTVVPPVGGKTSFEVIPAEKFDEKFMIDGSVDPDLLAEYMKSNYATDEKVQETQGWSIEENTEYVLALYNVVRGEYSVQVLRFTTPLEFELSSPNEAQWLFKSAEFDDVFGGGATTDYLFDLNVSMAEQYGDAMGFTACLAIDYEAIYGADAAGQWIAPVYGSHTVTPTDGTSGVISFNGMEIPYSDFAETTCKFDFSEFFMEDAGTVVVEATLAESPITVSPQ